MTSSLNRRALLQLASGAALVGSALRRVNAQPPTNKTWSFGEITVTKVLDLEEPFDAARAFPGAPLGEFDRNADWLVPDFYDPAYKAILFSFHSYLVRAPHKTIIVDTCFGNEKIRGKERHGAWLENLAATGVPPNDIDAVVCTHFHADHVGMNTRRINDRWVPTFPKARYIFNRAEVEKMRLRKGSPYENGVYEDSILPVIQAGQVDLIDGDHPITDGVRIVASPGHTVGHHSIAISSRGQKAILAGDILHSPIEVLHPEWINLFDDDKRAAIAERMKFLNTYTDKDVTVFPAHFGGATAGHIVTGGDGKLGWRPLAV